MRKAYFSPKLEMETVVVEDVMFASTLTGFLHLGDGDWGDNDDFNG